MGLSDDIKNAYVESMGDGKSTPELNDLQEKQSQKVA